MARAATKKARKAPTKGKSPAQAKTASRAPRGAPPAVGSPSLSARAIEHEAIAPEDRLLSPKVVGAMLGVSEKWLSAAREGRKSIEGPPFIKLGASATAPVRYNLAALRDWLAKRPQRLNTHGAVVTSFASATEFFTARELDQPWLFAEVGGELIDIFAALNAGVFERAPETPVFWLTAWDWLRYSSSSPSLCEAVASAVTQLRARGLAMHEEKVLELTTPAPKTRGKGSATRRGSI